MIELLAARDNSRIERCKVAAVGTLMGDVVNLERDVVVAFLGAHVCEPFAGTAPRCAPFAAHQIQRQLTGRWNRHLTARTVRSVHVLLHDVQIDFGDVIFFVLLIKFGCLYFHESGLLRMAREVAHVPYQVGHTRGTSGKEVCRYFHVVVEDLNLFRIAACIDGTISVLIDQQMFTPDLK